jgi:hypothetical protein
MLIEFIRKERGLGMNLKLIGQVSWPISGKLQEIIKAHAIPGGCVISFSDPNYNCISGGYHPIEVMVDQHGGIAYITDFSYVGRPPYEELVKELDFDFSCGRFGQMSRDYPIDVGRELYSIWSSNFCQYYQSGVYQVTVEEL